MSAVAQVIEALTHLRDAGVILAFYTDDLTRERTWTVVLSGGDQYVWSTGEVRAFLVGVST